MKTDCSQFDPFRSPGWRWDAITKLINDGGAPAAREDPLIRAVVSLLRGSRRRSRKDSVTLDEVVLARTIHELDDVRQWHLEALLLTDQPCETIAAITGLPSKVVDLYMRLHFDVRVGDRLRGDGWVLTQAIMGSWDRSDPPESAIWRYMAWAGGHLILELLVADFLGLPESSMPGRALLAAKARHCARMYFAPLHDLTTSARLVQEGRRLFDVDAIEKKKNGRLLGAHLDALSLAAGVSPTGQKSRNTAPGKATTTKVSATHPSPKEENNVHSCRIIKD